MAPPSLPLILVVQSMAAVSEVLGQRMSRRCHHRSILRANVSMSVWCFLQALVTLAVAEAALPASVTGGQGPASMCAALVAHPWLLFNAVNNSIYWISLSFLLREPLGAVLIVVAFLVAALVVDPLQAALGLPTEHPVNWAAALAGALGAVACTVDVPPAVSDALYRCMPGVRRSVPPPVPTPATATRVQAATAVVATESPTSALATACALTMLAACTAAGVAFMPVAEAHAGLNAVGYAALDQVLLPFTTLPLVALLSSSAWARALIGEPVWGPHASAAPSFRALLARTWAELNAVPQRSAAAAADSEEGRSAVEPAAGDAAMHPADAISRVDAPSILVAALDRGAASTGAGGSQQQKQQQHGGPGPVGHTDYAAGATPKPTAVLHAPPSGTASADDTTGEAEAAPLAPAGPAAPRGGDAGLERPGAWRRCTHRTASTLLCRGRSFWWTLVPFHGLEFGRTFALFFLVTTYDAGATYLTATLVRVALVWIVALLACTALTDWVGIEAGEARRALDPAALCAKALGSVCIVAALALQRAQ